MVLLSRMMLDERMRQEALRHEVRRARMAEEAVNGTVTAAGSPRAQSQFFARRFGHLAGRLKLQTA